MEKKIEILDMLSTGQGPTSVGKHFGIHEATIRTIKRNEAAIRYSVRSGFKLGAKTSSYTRLIIKDKMEKALVNWIETSFQKGSRMDGNDIRNMAIKMYKLCGEKEGIPVPRKINEFTASNNWLTGFLRRHNVYGVSMEEPDLEFR